MKRFLLITIAAIFCSSATVFAQFNTVTQTKVRYCFVTKPLREIDFGQLFAHDLVVVVQLGGRADLLLRFAVGRDDAQVVLLQKAVDDVVRRKPPDGLRVDRSAQQRTLCPPRGRDGQPRIAYPGYDLPCDTDRSEPFVTRREGVQLRRKGAPRWRAMRGIV